jgi:hypothetical protein
MIRTTISLHEATLKSAKRLARAEHRSLGETITELLNVGLHHREKQFLTSSARPSLPEFSMGKPRIPLEDKEGLFRLLDDPK